MKSLSGWCISVLSSLTPLLGTADSVHTTWSQMVELSLPRPPPPHLYLWLSRVKLLLPLLSALRSRRVGHRPHSTREAQCRPPAVPRPWGWATQMPWHSRRPPPLRRTPLDPTERGTRAERKARGACHGRREGSRVHVSQRVQTSGGWHDSRCVRLKVAGFGGGWV